MRTEPLAKDPNHRRQGLLRVELAALPPYVPGRAPSAPQGLSAYKISSNENPYPPLPSVLRALEGAAQQINRYPDLLATELVEAIAEHLGVPAAHVVPTPGSVAGLGQILGTVCDPGDEVVYAWRSFEAYPILVQLAGARPVPVPLAISGGHDLLAMRRAVTDRTRVVILCTPNNPTGPALRHEEVLAFAESLPEGVILVVDEAYREFVDDPQAGDHCNAYRASERTLVVRTFSKAYGLAGLRVGYTLAQGEVADGLRKTATPFAISGPAQAAALASLQPPAVAELLSRVGALIAERTRVVDALRSQGRQIPEAQGNFVWLPLGERSLAFAARAAEVGLSVRPFAGEGVRCSIGEAEASSRLIDLAASFG